MFFVLNYMAFGQCPPGGILFESQQDINDFAVNYPNCSHIQGGISIYMDGDDFGSNSSDIDNLEPLNQIRSIDGNLIIGSIACDFLWNDNPQLTSLSGLENLTTIGGSLWIESNSNLTDLTGLEGLTSIGGELQIGGSSLTNLNGLNNLESVQGIMLNSWVLGCGNIFDWYPLGNYALNSLSALENLQTLDDLSIRYNYNLATCNEPFICEFIENGGNAAVGSNAPGCNSEAQVLHSCSCTEQDSLALVSLYNATNGTNWNTTWNLNAPVSTWHGVTRTINGCVQELNLSNNNLVGTIPLEIGELAALTRLTLHSNSLSGSIPATIGDLGELRQIWLFSNQLSGTLPTEIGALSQLTHLGIGGNQLTGTIPTSYGDLNSLGFFTVKNNQLSGCFDENLLNICTAGNDSRINTGNNFEASWSAFCASGAGSCLPPPPVTCRYLDSLILIDLYNTTNGLGWIIQWDISQPINTWHGVTLNYNGCVKKINLHNNNLTGILPATLGEFSALTSLSLSSNQLSGNIPSELGNLGELGGLWLYANNLSGSIPLGLSNLGKLQVLDLNNNQLSGSIPPELSEMHRLDRLHLWHNQLTGNIPPELGSIELLNRLSVHHNQLSGSIPAELGNLSNLVYFHVNDNQLSGCFDDNLLNICASGSDTRVNAGNNFDGLWSEFCTNSGGSCSFPPATCTYTDSLALIDLYNATNGANWNTTWNLNQPMTTWQGITLNTDGCVAEINLNSNNLTGNIPPEIGELAALTRLNMHSNNLSGSIPNTIGNLSELRQIWLFNNQLSSVLPPEIGNLSQLTHFGIGLNQLTGTIPASYGNLANLVLFTLPQNQLSGCFDENLTNICDAAGNSNINSGNDFDALWSNFCTVGSGICQSGNSTTDSLALVAFYYATEGPDWFTTWDLNQPMTTWHGIALNPNRRVVSIEVDWNNQGGYIPPEIGDLTALRSLTLLPGYYCEDFPIPTCWVAGSQIGGCLPPEIGNLVNLEVLNVPDNQFCELPPELGNLSSIQYISMYGNGLSGGIPPEMGNLNNLNYLNLYGNPLSGSIPPELGSLGNLSYLNLYDTGLSGSIPPEMGSLSNLTELYLGNNQLDGNIPPELGNLNSLTELHLYDNQLSGNIPPELGSLNNLQGLYLFDNQLSGNIPSELGDLSNLQTLWLINNQLSGNIPPELGSLSNLQRLDLCNNQLSGSLPSELGNLSNLYRFYIRHNQLSGCFDDNLLNICSAGFDVTVNEGNNFDALWNDFCTNGAGSCSTPPVNCSANDSLALVVLYNSTNGANWTTTWNLNQPMSTWHGITLNANGCVTELNLSGNNLNGTIPAAVGNLANLERLNLHTNNLSGNIPPTIGDLSALRQIWLFSNQLSGTLPSEIGNLMNLTHLGIGGNQLTGSIPASYGNLSNLGFLALKNNNLSGCYDANLANICAAGNDSRVSSGNNFGASWSAFCTNLTGCCNCRLDMSDDLMETEETPINLYPNPANQFINIDIQTNNNNKLNYLIYNALGEIVQSGQIQSQQGKHQYFVELNNLNTGVYYFNLMIEDKQNTKHFTIIR